MIDKIKVFVVDDDPIILEVLQIMLESYYAVETFDSAEACLRRLKDDKPNMFLLDVSLPGLNGYDLCRRIKAEDELSSIPVIFVSGLDSLEARLSGYDAGGQDFIVKPFDPAELLRKAKVAQYFIASDLSKDEQTNDARNLALMVMANMDETGYVLAFMRNLLTFESEQEVAVGLLELTQKYGLDAVVQARVANHTHTLSAAGVDVPLEISVLEHIREMDRIFEFGRRSAYNFKYVTLMINDMPTDNPDFCGRLRDHLCFAGEAVDSRLRAVETERLNQRTQAGIGQALTNIHSTIALMEERHLKDRVQNTEIMFDFDQTLAKAFVNLGMTIGQENFLTEIIGEFTKQLIEVADRGEDAHFALKQLGDQLGQLK